VGTQQQTVGSYKRIATAVPAEEIAPNRQEKRAAIYARTAIMPQAKGHNPLAAQILMAQQYCTEHGYTLNESHIYQEVYSGAVYKNRPRLTELREAAKQGEFDIVVVIDYERLARNQALVAELINELEQYGVSVESIRESVDTNH
jgi:site-specific DNA recombinase